MLCWTIRACSVVVPLKSLSGIDMPALEVPCSQLPFARKISFHLHLKLLAPAPQRIGLSLKRFSPLQNWTEIHHHHLCCSPNQDAEIDVLLFLCRVNMALQSWGKTHEENARTTRKRIIIPSLFGRGEKYDKPFWYFGWNATALNGWKVHDEKIPQEATKSNRVGWDCKI